MYIYTSLSICQYLIWFGDGSPEVWTSMKVRGVSTATPEHSSPNADAESLFEVHSLPRRRASRSHSCCVYTKYILRLPSSEAYLYLCKACEIHHIFCTQARGFAREISPWKREPSKPAYLLSIVL